MPKVGDVVYIHLRNEGFKGHVIVVDVKENAYGLPVRVFSETPFEYFVDKPLHYFSVALNEIVVVDDEG